ncbi:MAG: sodium:proton antiporter [Desulfobacterales bacterium]|nr:sodium:proton antiporter [Desulfobacterales bacterium]
MNEHTVLSLSTILITGMACQWIAWRAKLPAIIFLLLSGIVAGPVMGWLNPDRLLGDLLFPFVSLAVAVILFEGSLTLKFQEIPGLERVIRNMITFGMLVTWMIAALATRWLLHFSWEVAFLFGALMVVTGPTVIVPMLRTVRPNENVANILKWEGILIDPIGATMAVLVYEIIISGGTTSGFGAGMLVFGKSLVVGLVLGGAGGQSFGVVLRRYWIPQYLQSFAALSLACGVFATSNALVPESGLLAVTVMGVWLANMRGVELDEILDFKENLSVLFISMLFILLAARLDLDTLLGLGWPALAVFAFIQFLARPLNAQISALGSKLSMAERHLLAWIAPRGIIAAAISALFAIKLEAIGYAEASRMVPLTFMVIIGTVLLQSATAGPIAKWLKVAEPEPKGFLIIGANAVSRAIGGGLVANGFRVLLADQDWNHIKAAKMEGLPTYYGNPVSEHAERNLRLVGIGRVLALTPNVELNVLAAQHFRLEFGANNLYTIRNRRLENGGDDRRSAFKHGGQPLFREPIIYNDLAERLAGGAEVKTTLLTEKFPFDSFLGQKEENRLALFAIDPNERIHAFTAETDFSPEAGWKIIGLSKTDEPH